VRKGKFTEDQIAFALKQNELGMSVDEVGRTLTATRAMLGDRRRAKPEER
jgi:hypothetical protein